MNNQKAIIADRIFTGDTWLTEHAVILSQGIIADIVPTASLSSGIETTAHPDCFLAPAFIDLQIYGAYGKLLAVYPEPDSLFRLNEYCNKGGAAFCLPTAATNKYEVFYQCIDAIREYWSRGGEGILGLHIEGPWINKLKRGAHIESLIHSPQLEEASRLLDYGKGVIKMVTLAPEVCSTEIINLLHSRGIIIAAGHSNATYEEANNGFNSGIRTVTHLYNAMSPLQHRAPGLVGAVMDHGATTASIIPDGYHVDYAAIRIAKKVMKERLFVITDAVTETDKGYYPHQLAGDKYESGGILSGSALDMAKALRNLVAHCRIELEEALRMCSLYPARVMGMDQPSATTGLGRIRKNYRAAIVGLTEELQVKELFT